MDTENTIRQMQRDIAALNIAVQELRAELAQLGPVHRSTSFDEEINAALAQGLDLAEYFHKRGKETSRRLRTKKKNK